MVKSTVFIEQEITLSATATPAVQLGARLLLPDRWCCALVIYSFLKKKKEKKKKNFASTCIESFYCISCIKKHVISKGSTQWVGAGNRVKPLFFWFVVIEIVLDLCILVHITRRAES